jgi:hypothetical protein
LDEHYREEPERPDRRLKEGDFHRREILQGVFDEHLDTAAQNYHKLRSAPC